MSIVIFSRPVRTGKTTELMTWCGRQNNITGVLMPDNEGTRKIINLSTNEVFNLECTDPADTDQELLKVGRFYFYASIFTRVNNDLVNMLKTNPHWMVLDEVGKLELNCSGFYDAVTAMISAHQHQTITSNILLVVRESLLNEVIGFFKIDTHQVVQNLQLLPMENNTGKIR